MSNSMSRSLPDHISEPLKGFVAGAIMTSRLQRAFGIGNKRHAIMLTIGGALTGALIAWKQDTKRHRDKTFANLNNKD